MEGGLINQIGDSEKYSNLIVYTGRGGMKEALKAACEVWGLEYNWRNMRQMYYMYLSTGLKVEGKCYIFN